MLRFQSEFELLLEMHVQAGFIVLSCVFLVLESSTDGGCFSVLQREISATGLLFRLPFVFVQVLKVVK